jgi:hypothetical protein
MKDKLFWVVIALSSIGAAIFGYHRFKQIRPDLFDAGTRTGVSETERAARITEYQQQGDQLTRLAAGYRAARAGESCIEGFVVEIKRDDASTKAKRVIENGRPVRCPSPPQR